MCGIPHARFPARRFSGISIAAVLYVLGTVVVMGIVPHEALLLSLAPFADAARIMWGPVGALVVGMAVMVFFDRRAQTAGRC
jgi:arginine:agmatine antiporter